MLQELFPEFFHKVEYYSDDITNSDFLIISSDPNFCSESANYIKPRKLGEEGKTEITEIDFSATYPDLKFIETQKFVDFKNNTLVQSLPEFRYWKNNVSLDQPLTLTGKVVEGFQRGSK